MNIRNIKTYILSGILALSLSSCLEKYPEDSIRMDEAINTVDDMDKLVTVSTTVSRAAPSIRAI